MKYMVIMEADMMCLSPGCDEGWCHVPGCDGG